MKSTTLHICAIVKIGGRCGKTIYISWIKLLRGQKQWIKYYKKIYQIQIEKDHNFSKIFSKSLLKLKINTKTTMNQDSVMWLC